MRAARRGHVHQPGRPDHARTTGYLLASALAQPNAQLSTLTTSSSDVLAFQSVLPGGKVAVALINTNTVDRQDGHGRLVAQPGT